MALSCTKERVKFTARAIEQCSADGRNIKVECRNISEPIKMALDFSTQVVDAKYITATFTVDGFPGRSFSLRSGMEKVNITGNGKYELKCLCSDDGMHTLIDVADKIILYSPHSSIYDFMIKFTGLNVSTLIRVDGTLCKDGKDG